MDELIRELKLEGVLRSPYVEAAFRDIDRKDFVLPGYEGEAYGNYPLPIGEGQTISQPYTVAFMLDLLDPKPGEKILDIGSGSGWTTALLAHNVREQGGNQKSKVKNQKSGTVYAIERLADLCEFGRVNASKYNFIKSGVVKFFCQDATAGLDEYAPFDKILASAAAFHEIPEAWRKQLKVGGKIVAPVGSSVWRYTKKTETEWEKEEYPGFAFVPLVANKANRENKEYGDDEEARSPRQRRNNNFIFPIFLIFLIFPALLACVIFVPVTVPGRRVTVEIAKGQGLRLIARELKSQGLIRSPWAFIVYAALSRKNNLLKPGSYEFGPKASIPSITNALVGGETNERTITIPEGWDLRDIGFYFENNGIFQAEELWGTAGFPAAGYNRPASDLPRPEDFSKEFSFLADKPRSVGLEGYLYPDTYRVFRDASVRDIIRKMLENFEKKLAPELRREVSRQKKSVFEIITMASLVEKEVPDNNERRIVSGILWKRYEAGIPLQVDASVNYVTGKRQTPSAEDLAIDSPYNTYRRPGLPLGPIASPGIDAIRAAVYPEPSPYFYYLSAPGGKTVFSRTLEEHNAAKAKYLK